MADSDISDISKIKGNNTIIEGQVQNVGVN